MNISDDKSWKAELDEFKPTVATTLEQEVDRKESEFIQIQRKLEMAIPKEQPLKTGNRFSLSATQKMYAEMLVVNDLVEQRKTQKEMAEELGVSVQTLRNWRQQKIFVKYLNELADTHVGSFIAEAYSGLVEIMRDGKNAERLKAIELLLKKEGKLRDKTEISVEDNRAHSVDEILAELDNL